MSNGEKVERKYFRCHDFTGLPCCSSCHEDNDHYDYDLCDAERDGHKFYMCCRGCRAIKEMSDTEFQKLIREAEHE